MNIEHLCASLSRTFLLGTLHANSTDHGRPKRRDIITGMVCCSSHFAPHFLIRVSHAAYRIINMRLSGLIVW